MLVRSRESIVEETNSEQEQLTEVMVVENQRQRMMEERWIPATVAVKDVDGAMLDEILREIEELDELYKLSDEDETIIDALLDELELENAGQLGGERPEFLDVEEVPKPCTGVYKVSVECTCDVTKVTVDQRRTSKQKGSAPSRVPKCIAVMSDTTARTQKELPPNAQLPPNEGDSGYPTGSIVGAKQKISRWACVGCAGRPTESMAGGNPTKW